MRMPQPASDHFRRCDCDCSSRAAQPHDGAMQKHDRLGVSSIKCGGKSMIVEGGQLSLAQRPTLATCSLLPHAILPRATRGSLVTARR